LKVKIILVVSLLKNTLKLVKKQTIQNIHLYKNLTTLCHISNMVE